MQPKILTIAVEYVSNFIQLVTLQTVCNMPTTEEIRIMLLGVLQSLLVLQSAQESQESEANRTLELLRNLYHTQITRTHMITQVTQETQTSFIQETPIIQTPRLNSQHNTYRRGTHYEPQYDQHHREPHHREPHHREPYRPTQRVELQRDNYDNRDGPTKIVRQNFVYRDNAPLRDLREELQDSTLPFKKYNSHDVIIRPFTNKKKLIKSTNGIHQFEILPQLEFCSYRVDGIDSTILKNVRVYYYLKHGTATPYILHRGPTNYLVASDNKLYKVVNKVVVPCNYNGVQQKWVSMF